MRRLATPQGRRSLALLATAGAGVLLAGWVGVLPALLVLLALAIIIIEL